MSPKNAAVLALFFLSGCPVTPPPTPPHDAAHVDGGVVDGGPDTGPRRDTGVLADADADVDGATERDAGDGGPDIDANTVEVDAFLAVDANVDAYVEPPIDGGPCLSPTADVCMCGTFGADCSTTSCGSGETCVADGCGMHCVPNGNVCIDDRDCRSGSSCTGGICVHAGAGCGDSRDCPAGFSCDSGTCHDRRNGCQEVDGLNCPLGFTCDHTGTSLCVRLLHHCNSSASCGGFTCVDIDVDGQFECTFNNTSSGVGGCHVNGECPAGTVCTAHPDLRFNTCDRYGVCRTVADCASGMECIDLWGDGIRECVDSGGSCRSQTDCPGNGICATPTDGGPPRCYSMPVTA